MEKNKMEKLNVTSAIKQIMNKKHLKREEAAQIMEEIMSGKVTNAQLGAFLTALSIKGETIEEVTGFAESMRMFAKQIKPEVKGELLDTCGTGGDKIKTFNISTISAFVIAGAGVSVAKHGNRAVTSNCGSADLLEGLGVDINLKPAQVKKCIETAGIGFMFAPLFHPAMKYAMPTRRELKIRTVFNILGPLTNPANAQCHVLGVFDKNLTQLMASVLGEGLHAKHIFSVHNSCGVDELIPAGINYITEYDNGIKNYAMTNEDFGLPKCQIEDLLPGSVKENLKIAVKILKDEMNGPKYDTILMNAALALQSVNMTEDLKEGIEIAENSIKSGKAYRKLEDLIKVSIGNRQKLLSVI
ncbi:MAG: anthranilate phosphoribosyltransferase [Promethearchaeia archaeon]